MKKIMTFEKKIEIVKYKKHLKDYINRFNITI